MNGLRTTIVAATLGTLATFTYSPAASAMPSAMPIAQPASADDTDGGTALIDKAWWRGGWGWHRGGGWHRGYGWRGGYGWHGGWHRRWCYWHPYRCR
jgi:hypothetical protein